jgi:hypothetical protein
MASQPTKTATRTGPSDPAEMLTPKEFAKVRKVSTSWLAKARKRGRRLFASAARSATSRCASPNRPMSQWRRRF